MELEKGERFLPAVPSFVRHGAPSQYLKGIRIVAGSGRLPGRRKSKARLREGNISLNFPLIFAEEENWLKVIEYPGLQFQKKQHEFFISQVTDLQDRYSRGEANIPLSTLEFLRDWLLSHILEKDKKYGTFMLDVRE